MAPQPPSFGSKDYWDDRFTSNPSPFEWLEAPNIIDPPLVAVLRDCIEDDPQLLHIGCGTSLLSYHLRAHVKDPRQIHNVDYAKAAIDSGKKREEDMFAEPIEAEDKPSSLPDASIYLPQSFSKGSSKDIRPCMRWSVLDLLSLRSILSISQPSTYSIVIDKSTSDSMACAEDVQISLPYPISFSRSSSSLPSPPLLTTPIPLHPLHVLSLHLAFLTKPGGRWISVSYSDTRFPFLPSYSYSPSPSSSFSDDEVPETLLGNGFPHPGELWELEHRYAVEAPEVREVKNGDSKVETKTYRPKVLHWVYVLKRTEKEICVREWLMGP